MKHLCIVCIFITLTAGPALSGDKPMRVEDIMKFRSIQDATISETGAWVAFTSRPDRGDAEGVVRSTDTPRQWRIERAAKPTIAKTGAWAAFVLEPAALAVDKAGSDKKKQEKLKNGAVLINNTNGESLSWERVKSFAFSDDGHWFARLHLKEPEDEKESPAQDAKQNSQQETRPEESSQTEATGSGQSPKKEKKKKDKTLGAKLVLRNLNDGGETEIEGVTGYAFDGRSRFLVYALSLEGGAENGLYFRELADDPGPARALTRSANTLYPKIAWDEKGNRLAFLQSPKPEEEQDGAKEKKKKPKDPRAILSIWNPKKKSPAAVQDLPAGWGIPDDSQLTWTKNGQRLFFGLKPRQKPVEEEPESEEIDLYDVDRLTAKRTLDVWHGKDPRIKTQERKIWEKEQRRTWLAVHHVKSGKTIQLASKDLPNADPTENPHGLILSTDLPYRRKSTWTGMRLDYYLAPMKDGKRIPIVSETSSFRGRPVLAPGGRFAAWFKDRHVHLLDIRNNTRTNLTASLRVSFADEDHDRPSEAPGYGFGGWLAQDRALLVYDKYDIWLMPTDGKQPRNLTGGRSKDITFRLVETDEDRQFFEQGETLLLSGYHQRLKKLGFYQMQAGEPGVRVLLDEEKRCRFIAKAKKADRMLYTSEDFREFPDLWISDTQLADARKLTLENPQIEDFAWGSSELVSWRSTDGKELQGVLIKPGNYEPGKRYPILVYYYRFFSQRLHQFNQMKVNHRPNFPFYTSNGYAIFLPDIRFEVGTPGASSVQALVPGIQKLIDMGIADEKAIGLHGHSWSGYQTAFAVTQTDVFACAVAGAPVSNMTSAYSGIRLGTGLARQFQYEAGQSRIGASLWERRDLYIENSPVFFADRINTPMLIMFGDVDDAVPWQQGIELYLALRRLHKDVVFLQYRGEPHHLKQYPNKLDYTLKMKAYLDHYLKGEPAPAWLAEGEPFQGDGSPK